jgi:putative membrane protein
MGRWFVWGAFAAIFAATWWHPIYPPEQALHHSLTLLAVAALLWLQRRGYLPLRSLVLCLVFLTMHTIAARWIYSYVPYDDWLHALFGFRLSDTLGWQRNDFDRLVHLSYGLCIAPVLFAYFTGRRGWRPGWAALVAVDIIVSTGALYELFEWGIAATLAPGYAEAYNGQQGDLFDAQKDMAVAALGAVVSIALVLLVRATRRVPPPVSTVDLPLADHEVAVEVGLNPAP